MHRYLAVAAIGLVVTGCGGDHAVSTPVTPTPVATPTRVLDLDANLAFGTITIGQSFDAVLRLYNRGTAVLTVSALQVTGGLVSVVAASWTSGTIAPGTSQASTIRFTPTAAQSYSGTVTVVSDATSGPTSVPISGTGVFPPRDLFRRAGTGDAVFDLPPDMTRVHIVATYPRSSQNFIVRLSGRLLVNEILGTSSVAIGTRYDGTLLTPGGGTVAITNSSGVDWSFEEVR